MEINPIKNSDVSELSHLQPEGWVNIMPVFEFYVNSPFCFPIKMTIDDEIIGLGCAIIHDDVAWLAHIIVQSDYRQKGIGLQITQTLVDIAKDNHCTTSYLIATELGEPVYKKVGFITETEYLVYKKVAKKDWVISEHIHPYEDTYKEQIKILDQKTSGEERLNHIENHFSGGFIYCWNGIIEGYYLPGLGEGLIIANNQIAGIELLKLHLTNNNCVIIPQENEDAHSFLIETGTGDLNKIKRMRLGKEREVRFANIYNRIAGNIG